MRRHYLFALALVVSLLSGLGCATSGGGGDWEEVMKDLRGDNMKMRSSTSLSRDSH